MGKDKITKIYENIFRSEGGYLSDDKMINAILVYYASNGKRLSSIDELIWYVEEGEHFIFLNLFGKN